MISPQTPTQPAGQRPALGQTPRRLSGISARGFLTLPAVSAAGVSKHMCRMHAAPGGPCGAGRGLSFRDRWRQVRRDLCRLLGLPMPQNRRRPASLERARWRWATLVALGGTWR